MGGPVSWTKDLVSCRLIYEYSGANRAIWTGLDANAGHPSVQSCNGYSNNTDWVGVEYFFVNPSSSLVQSSITQSPVPDAGTLVQKKEI
jgi:hypothetical protein